MQPESGDDWTSNSLPSHTVVDISPTATKNSNVGGNNNPSKGSSMAAQNAGHNNSDCHQQPIPLMMPNHSRTAGGWFNGLLGCLRPVWTIIGKATSHDLKHQQSGTWESFLCVE